MGGAGGALGQVWCCRCPAGRFGEAQGGFVPRAALSLLPEQMLSPPCQAAAGCPSGRWWSTGTPTVLQPLGRWLRISTAKAHPLILLPARQLPWRAPRSTSCHPLPCPALPETLLPALPLPFQLEFPHSSWNFPIPAGNPDGFPSAAPLGKLFQPAFPVAGAVHIGPCLSQSCRSHPHPPIPAPRSASCPLAAFPQGWDRPLAEG